MNDKWWQKPLKELSKEEWEALCDGCGLCCLNKMEDIDTGDVYFSRVACQLLDIKRACCQDYCNRQQVVPDCLNLADLPDAQFSWLPPSCSYRLRHEGKDLPDWHYLITGDKNSVHERGRSVCHFALSEKDGYAIDDHLLFRLEDVLGVEEE